MKDWGDVGPRCEFADSGTLRNFIEGETFNLDGASFMTGLKQLAADMKCEKLFKIDDKVVPTNEYFHWRYHQELESGLLTVAKKAGGETGKS
jgi:hypothetical protein